MGAVTPEQLQRLETDAPSFAALFTQLHVRPTSADETLRMLLHEARELEHRHHVPGSPTLFPTLLEQAGSLFPGAALPGKALDLLRELGRGLRRQRYGTVDSRDALRAPARAGRGCRTSCSATQQAAGPGGGARGPLAQGDGPARGGGVACDLVVRIHAGLTDPRRPYGVFLFTGPTGTGKTELATRPRELPVWRCLAHGAARHGRVPDAGRRRAADR